MSDLPKLEWLRVRGSEALERVIHFVRGHHVNTYNAKPDRNGDWIILLGWDDRPDSDWGRFKGNSAAIWFSSQALAHEGERLVRSALKWGDADPVCVPAPTASPEPDAKAAALARGEQS